MTRFAAIAVALLAVCATGSCQNPLTSSALPTLNVRDYGAKGDGVTDDYSAILSAVAAVNRNGGGTIVFPPGVYRINRYRVIGGPLANGVANIVFSNCNGLFVIGYGASFDVKGDIYRSLDTTSESYVNTVVPLYFKNCRNFTVKGFDIDGNVDRMTRHASVSEGPSHGVVTDACSYYTLRNVYSHHFAGDGLYLGLAPASADRFALVENVRLANNARDGASAIHLRDATFRKSAFLDNGLTDGAYGAHPPMSGFNVEPDRSVTSNVKTGNITVSECTLANNVRAQVQSAGTDKENITLQYCVIDRASSTYDNTVDLAVINGTITNCTMNVRQIVTSWENITGTSTYIRNNAITTNWRGITDYVSTPGKTAVIENNTITGNHTSPATSYMPFIHNSGTIFRGNSIFVPKAAKTAATATMVTVLQKVALSTGNTFRTDYVPSGTSHFYTDYTGAAKITNDVYASGPAFRPGPNSTWNTASPYSR